MHRRGVSLIMEALLLASIALAAIAALYAFTSAYLFTPVYSASITSYSLVKFSGKIFLVVSVENTGSAPLRLMCLLYGDSGESYTATPSPLKLAPGVRGSFHLVCNGGDFTVGRTYRLAIFDSDVGFYLEVRVLCLGQEAPSSS